MEEVVEFFFKKFNVEVLKIAFIVHNDVYFFSVHFIFHENFLGEPTTDCQFYSSKFFGTFFCRLTMMKILAFFGLFLPQKKLKKNLFESG